MGNKLESLVAARTLFFSRNKQSFKNLLELSRDQVSLNRMAADCQGFSGFNLERVFFYALIWSKHNAGKSLLYDITHDFHTVPCSAPKTDAADKEGVFLQLGLQNAYVMKITLELIFDCANGMLEHDISVGSLAVLRHVSQAAVPRQAAGLDR